ncbi:hypothetical protein [Marivita sp. S2033]|uniref:hypothetical protein n=1 Tax=Marivita sp. S2033 TaxID=3373187 RepID=UPI003981A976
MISSNKILTVSYGTFSCTLEGFDRSFDTMKAIAEYFRDLAQDDRYFGAEPPTPDAEMLARIAEREIERRVEARFEKGSLVLRPTDDAEPPHGDVAPEQSSDASTVDATAGATAIASAVANTSGLDMETEDAPTADDDIAAEENIVALSLDDSEPDGADLDGAELEDTEIDLSSLDITDESDDVDLDAPMLTSQEDLPEELSLDDLIAAQTAMARKADAELLDDTAPTPIAADSVADKLQRIRAVVASRSQEEPEYTEDEHAMSGPDGDGNAENDAIEMERDLPGFDPEDDTTEDQESPVAELDDTGDNLFTDTIAALVNDRIEEEDSDEDQILPDVAYDDDEADASGDVAPDSQAEDTQAEIEVLRAKIAELEAQAAAASEQSIPDTEEPETLETEEPETPDSSEDDTSPLVARVSKAKRSDVDAALAAGTIEEYDDEDDDTETASEAPSVSGAQDSTLSAEQEAELARELAELQAEIDEDDDWNFDEDDDTRADTSEFENDDLDDLEDEADANIRKAVKMTSPGRAMLTDTPIEEDDTSVDRLIDQAETEMDEPEGNRRRSAIAHLRAAVAATKADRLLGRGKKVKDEEEPYREDLADAVRPRRPTVAQARSERPAPVRPAPLKLVAEQRVDVETATYGVTPVRPRRVLRSADAMEPSEGMDISDDAGFAEFAEGAGAHTLPELLEAAASYMSFVEGRDQFSRPQLMTKLLQAEGEASSREERLRSFGQLLRDGKIEKKGGGRFTASDSIGFKPSSRAAG